jgi:hypothetical protein
MTMPVMPSNEALEYVPTQAIADFLASQIAPELDGILFPSVQVAGDKVNVVLFHKAAKVAEITYPPGTKFRVKTGMFNGEEWEPDLTVIEMVPPSERAISTTPSVFDGLDLGNLSSIDWDSSPDRDIRQVTLEVDMASLEVRRVRGVKFVTEDERVERMRFEGQRGIESSDF